MGYLCEGLAEDLMNALFSVQGLRVLSSTDTFAFKDSHRGTREIGASLGATVVLEGSVQHAGNRIAEQVKDPTGVLQRTITRSFDALNRVQRLTRGG